MSTIFNTNRRRTGTYARPTTAKSGRRTIACVIAILCAAAAHVCAQVKPDADKLPPLEYIRIDVTDEVLRTKPPTFGYDFIDLPIELAEFERLLQAAGAQTGGAVLPEVVIRSAKFSARLEGDALVGTARLDVQYEPQKKDAPATLALDGCNFAIAASQWEDGRPATLGLGADGRVMLPVDKSGVLTWNWSLRGERDSGGNLLFDLHLPATIEGQVGVELPAENRIIASQGVIEMPQPIDGGWQRWPIQLGGLRSTQLTVAPIAASDTIAGVLLASQRCEYKVDAGGIQLSSEMKLDARDVPADLRGLALKVDPGIRLVGVALDGEKVSWEASDSEAIDTGAPHEITLDLTSALPALGRGRLVLSAVGPTPLGREAVLPAIRPTGVVWQSGVVALHWDHSLQLDALDVSGGTLAALRAADTEADDAIVNIAQYDPDGRARVLFSPRSAHVSMWPTYAWRLLADRTLARLSADLECSREGTHELSGQLAAGWLIDKDDVRILAAGQSPDAPSSPVTFRVEPDYDTAADVTRPLRIVFDPPLTTGQRLRLEIKATNRQKLPADSFPLTTLQFLRLDDVAVTELTGAITASPPQSARLQGDSQIAFLPLDQLDQETLAWLAPESSVAVFSSAADIGQVGVQLVRGTRRLGASTDVAVMAQAGRISESYEFRCTPDAAGMERLRVQFSPPRTTPLEWSFPDEMEPGEVTAVRVSSEAVGEVRGDVSAAQAEIWEIAFQRRQTSPITIQAHRPARSWSGESAHVSLAAVLDATSQTGHCVVQSSASAPLVVKVRGARQVVPPTGESGTRTWGSFRYTPSPSLFDADLGIEIARLPADEQTTLAWQLLLESDLSGGNTASHRATWLVHNEGLAKLTVHMPPQAAVQSAAINGAAAAPQHDDDLLTISLPPDQPFVRLTIDYTTPQAAAGVWRYLTPPTPQLEIPVLHRRWRVSLPRGYAAAPDRRLYAQAADRAALREQLFGPFGNMTTGKRIAPPSGAAAIAGLGGDNLPRGQGLSSDAIVLLAGKLAQYETTWGQALLDYQLSPASDPIAAGRLLLIDAGALAAAGIAPESPINLPAAASPVESMAQLLEASRLALVVTHDYMILTGADFARSHAEQLASDRGGVAWVTGGSLAELMSQPMMFSANVTTPQIWASSLAPGSAPWTGLQERTLAALTAARGVYEISLADGADARLVAYNVAALKALAFAAMLAALAGGLWRRGVRLSWIFAAMLLVAAVTLMLPSPWGWIGSGLLVGMWIAVLFRLCRSVRRNSPTGDERDEVAPSPSPAGRVVRTACWLPLALMLATTSTSTGAADPDAAPLPYPVWFRVDDKGAPTGYVDLPKEFMAELKKRAAAAAAPSRQWVITAAEYRLPMQWHATEPTLEAQELQIDFTFDVLDDVTHVDIPLPRGGMTLLEDGATLNDSPIEVRWRLRDEAIRVPVAAQGEHRLRLRVRPAVATRVDVDQFEIVVPPAPGARLHVLAPRDAPAIEVPSCVGRIATAEASGDEEDDESTSRSVTADLGPADRLTISWPHRRATEEPPAAFNTEELYWLTFDEEGPRLEVQVRSTAKESPPKQLTLETTSQAALAAGTVGVEPAISDTSPRWRKFQFPATSSSPTQALTKASFRLTDVPAAGRYVLPQFRIPGAGTRRLTFAITPPAGVAVASPDGLTATSAANFFKRWGGEVDPMCRAFKWDLSHPAASLLLSPQPPTRAARQSVRYAFGRRSVDVLYRAELDAAEKSAARLQYEVDVPAALDITSVRAVPLDAAERPMEDVVAWWSHDGDSLRIFLKQPLAGPHELLVEGRLPLAENGRVRLAAMQLHGVDLEASKLFLYRRPDVLVQVTQAADYENLPSDPIRHEAWGRLAAHLQTTKKRSGGWRPVSLRVLANDPQATGVQLTRLVRDGVVWNLLVDVDVQVHPQESAPVQSVVDTLEFQIPAEFEERLTFDPPIEHYFLPTQDPVVRRVVAVPGAPIADALRLRMSVDDVIGPGQEVRAADIRPAGGVAFERYVAVPRAFESQSIVWDTVNLQAANPPSVFESLNTEIRELKVYRVLEDPLRLTLRSLRTFAGVPLVRLADVRFAWDGDRRVSGLATYDLEPAGMSSCQIEVPANLRLLEVRIGELPVQAERKSPQMWRVKLADHNLPQRVEVLYAGDVPAGNSSRELTAIAPRLADVTIERTVWSVYSPAWAGVGECDEGGELNPVQQDALRLRALTELIRLPSLHRLEHSTRETHDWIAPWQSRWQRRRRDVIRGELLAGALTDGQSPRVDTSAVDQTYALAMDELKLPAETYSAIGPTLEADNLWESSVAPQGLVHRRMVKGASQTINVVYDGPSDSTDWWLRACLILSLLVAAGLVATCPRWLPRSDWPLRSGHALGVLVGLGWALFLWPAALGWAIVALSLLTLGWRPKGASDRGRHPDIVVQSAE